MVYGKGVLKDGRLVAENVKTIDQSTMTGDCWIVQFEGLKACESCEYRGKKSCGGGATLKKLQAAKETK